MRPLRVAVLVNLPWRRDSGGHVKTWERIAAAAAALDRLRLEVHFSGGAPGAHTVGPNATFVVHRAALSTERLPFLRDLPDHTDLAPHHRALAAALRESDVVHTTDASFAFARTAERVAARTRAPLVHSVHTDAAAYTRLYTGRAVERWLGPRAGRAVLARLAIDRRVEERARRRLGEHMRRCAFVLVSRAEDRAAALAAVGAERTRALRRGVDRTLFGAQARDRVWLAATLDVPADRVVVLFVGRVDAGKNVMALARAVRRLADGGAPVHLVCAGEGGDRAAVTALLGARASCPGFVPPESLARLYAAADLLAHPSSIEVSSNVVREALASGVPVVVARGAADTVPPDAGVVVDGDDESAWHQALSPLVARHDRRAELARGARRAAGAIPGWRDVLEQDLWPVWQRAAGCAP